jgi:hypothetical protein
VPDRRVLLLSSVDDLIQGLGEFLPQLSALIWFLIATYAIFRSYLAVHWDTGGQSPSWANTF